MNTLKAVIRDIKGKDSVHLVDFDVAGESLVMMGLELNGSLDVGSEVILGIKATTVSLALEKNSMMTISNQIPVRLESVNKGELLCSVKFSFMGTIMESIITKDAALRMALKPDDKVIALIKASDLSIVEIV